VSQRVHERMARRVCRALGTILIDVRDRALLLVGFLSACRASNLVALDVPDATFSEQGVDLLLRRSKVDQTGASGWRFPCSRTLIFARPEPCAHGWTPRPLWKEHSFAWWIGMMRNTRTVSRENR
jgi:hypothetical protein